MDAFVGNDSSPSGSGADSVSPASGQGLGQVGWKEARKLVINGELISTGDLSMPADEDAPMADFLIGS